MSQRRSRWADAQVRVPLEPFPAKSLTQSQLNAYLTHVRLDEINKKLRAGEYYPTYRDRSPSPEPIFDAFGKRINGREDRYRGKLENERSLLIEQMIQANPELNKNIDHQTYLDIIMSKSNDRYAANLKKGYIGVGNKPCEKVWIPQDEFPMINFIGLLIGPRGGTLQKMEADTGAKISIRGKGSAKEGRMDQASSAAANEPLHAFVSADSMDKVDKAVAVINKIIETAASTPEEENDLKRQQLRQLAIINGTLRDGDDMVCGNCGQPGHRSFDCMEARNVTNNLLCRICGSRGHMSSDCLHKDNPEMLELSRQRSQQIDRELSSFLSEIGNVGGGHASVPPPPPPPTAPADSQPPAGAAPWGAQPGYPYPPPHGQANPWAAPQQ